MKIRALIIASFFILLPSASASAQTVISAKQSGENIEIRNLTFNDNVVSGEIVNHSRREVRNVELLIQHVWHWKNEFQPGSDQLGTASYNTVATMIPPGAAVPFTYRQPGALTAARTDGQYKTMVSVAGFTEIVPSQ